MSANLSIEQLAEDLSLAVEINGEWGYVLENGELIGCHYSDEGDIDSRVVIDVTFKVLP